MASASRSDCGLRPIARTAERAVDIGSDNQVDARERRAGGCEVEHVDAVEVAARPSQTPTALVAEAAAKPCEESEASVHRGGAAELHDHLGAACPECGTQWSGETRAVHGRDQCVAGPLASVRDGMDDGVLTGAADPIGQRPRDVAGGQCVAHLVGRTDDLKRSGS